MGYKFGYKKIIFWTHQQEVNLRSTLFYSFLNPEFKCQNEGKFLRSLKIYLPKTGYFWSENAPPFWSPEKFLIF